MSSPKLTFAVDFYSGYLEEVLNTIGSRDVTLVERFQRLGEHTQRSLGIPDDMMTHWDEWVERLIMDPPTEIHSPYGAVAMASLLCDAGQRRFRAFSRSPEVKELWHIFDHIGRRDWAGDLLDSPVGEYRSVTPRLKWGFLDVNQVEQLLFDIFGNDSFKKPCTAAIAGRMSTHSRGEAERELLEVGIETQNSVSHNIDYLIIGSKGTGGSKHDKVKALQKKGHDITVLDEPGFRSLIHSPLGPDADWDERQAVTFENFVSALRHVWAFELDLYVLTYEFDPSIDLI